MRCNAMRRSLRKYEHFGMIDDRKGRTWKEGDERERGMRGSLISMCMRVGVRVYVSVQAQVPLPLTT